MNVTSYRYYKLNYVVLKFLRLWNTEATTPEILVRLAMLYCFFMCTVLQVKFLFARIEGDWNALENMDEYSVLNKYTVFSKFLLNAYILFSVPFGGALITYGYTPIILDIVMPLNESRPRELMMLAEFFVIDPAEHFVPINLFVSVVAVVGITLIIVTDGSYVMFIMHNCAMFKIAG
nr:uncharacterized protein LOC117223922 [Megalopta genalis]